MRIGIMSGAVEGPDRSLEGLLELAKRVEDLGFASLWLAQVFGLDAITALSIVGRETRRIELGTAVVPTYPRHPFAMAQQALTAQVACLTPPRAGGKPVVAVYRDTRSLVTTDAHGLDAPC